MTINRGFSAVVMISGLVLAPLAADAASAVRPRLPDAVSASQVKRLVGSVAPGIDGVARWMCASGGNSAHPRTLDLEHDVAVEDFAGGAFRLLFGYDPDNGGSDSKGQVRATVRLRKAGESKSTKIASFRGLQNTGSGDALAIVDVNALVQAGDSLLWSFSFKKMAKMLDTACFFMLAAISKTDDSCRDYPDWSTSTYVLPFQPGERSVITQGNCFIGSHRGEAQYAYDFGMPIGTEIVAISSGVVVGVDDTHPDNTGIDGHDNVLTIEDDDGLLARYVHLTQGGALVSVGDVVQQGQVIALSGNSGSTSGIPHLHLQLTSCTDRSVCGTLPMTFRNTSWLSINALGPDELQEGMDRLLAEIDHERYALGADGEQRVSRAVELLHATTESAAQPAAVLPSRREHFGYRDGYGNPQIDGAGGPRRTRTGKLEPDGHGWEPLATGEFIFGHANEGMELPEAPLPHVLSNNGTYLVYRKLHQRVASFRRYLEREGARYGDEELFAAKLVGRWRDGFPLTRFPDRTSLTGAETDKRGFSLDDNLFTYGRDPEGLRCPIGAHIRRANPRDSQGFGGKLANRRRIIRRGLPYGDETPPDQPGNDDDEHGIIFMVVNANLETQFENVVSQWLNYGNEFGLGGDQDVLLGNHDDGEPGEASAANGGEPHKVVIPGDSEAIGGRAPFICRGLPRFVDTRGGDYFFLPSVTALELLSRGEVQII